MNFSAAKLLKNSAKKLVYLEKNKKERTKSIPERMLKGQIDADNKTNHKKEMRGTIKLDNDNLLFFSWDEVFDCDDMAICIERKWVDNNPEDWYKENSIAQTAFYAALTEYVDELYTAKFARKEGMNHVDLRNKTCQFVLCFGDEEYDISIRRPEMFLNHLKDKAWVVKQLDYDKAEEWDRSFKHKEYMLYKQLITCTPR